MRTLSYIGAEKITFLPKPDIHTYRRTDISVYRVASLLKRFQRGEISIKSNEKTYLIYIGTRPFINSMIIAGEIHRSTNKIISLLRHNGRRVVQRGVRTPCPSVNPLGDRPQLFSLPPRALGAEGVGSAGEYLIVVL